MSDTDAIRELQSRLNFPCSTATAFVRGRGRCEYCGQDLLRDRQSYASLELDHLLAKERCDTAVSEHPANWVLSCRCCNSTKGEHDVLVPGEDATEMLSSHRSTLIGRARKFIRLKMQDYDRQWRLANEILEATWWSWCSEGLPQQGAPADPDC